MKQVIICPKCHNENKANADKCITCGASLIMVPPTVVEEQAKSEAPRYLICPVCGEKNYLKEGQSAGSIKFCKECEQDDIRNLTEDDVKSDAVNIQAQPATANTPREDSEKKATIGFKFVSDKDQRCILIEEGTHIIGKSGDIDPQYFKEFRYVSREHAHVKLENGVISVKDVSTNGTFINDKAIDKNEWVELSSGDKVRFAEASFEVSLC